MQKEFKVASKATLDKVKELVGNNSSGCVTMLKLGKYVENIGGNKSISTLPYELLNGCVVVYNNEIHILGGENSKTSHYKWNGTEWTSVSTLPYEFYDGSAVVYNNEIHILSGPSSYRTNHYRILSGYYKDVELFLFKGCVIDNDNTLYPFQNCVYENGVLTVTEDGIVKFGVETTENDITLVIGGGS